MDITDQAYGGVQGDYNRVWYRLPNQTYIYSGWVQSVTTNLNPAVTEIPETGVLGEITIPFADSSYGVNSSPSPGPRLYYATTHWITAEVVDKRDGSAWYKAYDAAIRAIATSARNGCISSRQKRSPRSRHKYRDTKKAYRNPPGPPAAAGVRMGCAGLCSASRDRPEKITRVQSAGSILFISAPHTICSARRRISLYSICQAYPGDTYITDNGVAHGTYWHNDFGTHTATAASIWPSRMPNGSSAGPCRLCRLVNALSCNQVRGLG